MTKAKVGHRNAPQPQFTGRNTTAEAVSSGPYPLISVLRRRSASSRESQRTRKRRHTRRRSPAEWRKFAQAPSPLPARPYKPSYLSDAPFNYS
ncbi:hypothetical protein EVAR_16349_1 [Eumeta japonica]|uniref:Uncharacterized protein n=1 Tax=Eumeta variegata TaxID=151549 RepID=A0A4C1VHN0_EUMVA|nr:hypothetical protein EVAR_16349_1 [Eumeta japonica]